MEKETTIQATLLQLSSTPTENPKCSVQVGQNHFEFLVDSGATVSAINKTGILQETNQTWKTVGIAGIASETISNPVPTIVSHVPLEQKFLISPTSPVTVHPRVYPRYHLNYGPCIKIMQDL